MRAARCAGWAALIGVAGWMGPTALRAQPVQEAAAEGDAEYAKLVSGALSEFEQGRWEQARTWFERAHALRPSARTFWGLGVTSFELGRHAQAVQELQSALRDPRLPLESAQRHMAEDVIERAARHVAMVSVEVAPARAQLSLDGVQTADRELVLTPGRYTLAASAPGFREREVSVEASAGDRRVVRLQLSPIALDVRAGGDPGRAATAPAPPPRDEGSVLEEWWLWTAVGAALAGGVIAAIVVSGDDEASGPKVDARREVLTRQR